MLKRMLLRKFMVSLSLILVLIMLYFIPERNTLNLNENQVLEYINPKNLEPIYLLDDTNNLTRVTINITNDSPITMAKDIISSLTIDSSKMPLLPKGFSPIIPKNTKILDIKLDNHLLTIDFSSEFNNISLDKEEKLIESLVYSLTSIPNINDIKILVDGKQITKLPNSQKELPQVLNRNYGINKKYEITSLNNIDNYTIYYVLNYNNETYYQPVTKYVNSKEKTTDKVRIIIDELSSSYLYENNLMSYLDSNIKLLDYEKTDKVIKLNFNDAILSNISDSPILEEVMYTIGLSICDDLSLEEVTFLVNNKEISTFSLKRLDL